MVKLKRRVELISACALLAFTLPLWLVVSLLIKCESAGPVFESRERIGRNGRRFRMLRFRTKVHSVPQRAQQPTRLAWFLWNTRVAALPELINVLRGEMCIADTSLFG